MAQSRPKKVKTLIYWGSEPELRGRSLRMTPGGLHKRREPLSVPDAVADEAASVRARAMDRGLTKGWTNLEIEVSSLYAACREREVPVTLDDAVATSGVPRDDIWRCYRLPVTGLGLEIPISEPVEYLSRVASSVGARPDVEADAREILSRAAKAGITGGPRPLAIAASALYLASLKDGQTLTQTAVADMVGVGEVTIGKQCKILRKIIATEAAGTPRGGSVPGPSQQKVGLPATK